RTDACRVAVRAQLLDSPRPTGLLEVVRRLTLLQIDPTAAIAPNADLVAWSRLGSSYSPAQLAAALEDRTLVELRAMIRPSEDLALYRADMAGWASAPRGRESGRGGVRARRGAAQRRLPPGHPGPARLLGAAHLARAPRHLQGAVEVERVDQQPQRLPAAGVHGPAGRGRDRRATGQRPAGGRGGACAARGGGERNARWGRVGVGEAGEPAVVEGVGGEWRVDPALLDQPF